MHVKSETASGLNMQAIEDEVIQSTNKHMKNFESTIKTVDEKEKKKRTAAKEEMEKQIKSEKKKRQYPGATLCLKSHIMYKRLLKKPIKKTGEEGEEQDKKGQVKVEECLMEETQSMKPWMLGKKEAEICFESLVKKIDYDNLEILLYKN